MGGAPVKSAPRRSSGAPFAAARRLVYFYRDSTLEDAMRLLAVIGVLAIIAVIAGAIYFLGGFYSVAGNVEDPGLVNWALIQVREASIDKHAHDAPPPSFDEAANVQAGARAFAARGCTNCHGGPGVGWAKFSEGLNPGPPDLKDVVNGPSPPTPAQLFWIIKNGIKMTGMPSFGATGTPDDEIWKIAAFVKKLPSVSPADYKTWTAAP
jgi:cytochrome c553